MDSHGKKNLFTCVTMVQPPYQFVQNSAILTMCQAVCAGVLNLEAMMNRVEIIEEISEIAKFRDAPLIAAAMDVVRNPDNETMMNTAQKLLL